jgi:hypothetical protein
MIKENKISKYLLYAIGEIALVMIGILLALQVNNSNQNKANESKMAAILGQIERELLIDAQNAHSLNQFWKVQDSLYKVAMSDSVNIEMYQKSARFRDYSNTWEGNTIQTSGFELLKQNSNLANENLTSLISKISEIYDYYSQEFELNYNDMSKFQNHRTRQISEKYDWWYKSKLSDEWLLYYLNNPEYKNYITQHKNIISACIDDSQGFMRKAVDILQLIAETQTSQKTRKETILSKIIGPITSFKTKPFNKNTPKSNFKIGSKSYCIVFTNETSGPVGLSALLKTGDDFSIKENSFAPYSESKPMTIASGKSYLMHFIEGITMKIIDVNGDCIGYHITTKENSVIIIE